MLARTLVAALLSSSLLGCIKLECEETELDSVDACGQVVSAVTDALFRCGLSSTPASSVCQSNCHTTCLPAPDVTTCVSTIEALGCDQASVEAVVGLASCSEVIQVLKDATCSSSSGDEWND